MEQGKSNQIIVYNLDEKIKLKCGIKGKLGEDVGQPGIRAGDTRLSHMSLKGECGTPWYHQ